VGAHRGRLLQRLWHGALGRFVANRRHWVRQRERRPFRIGHVAVARDGAMERRFQRERRQPNRLGGSRSSRGNLGAGLVEMPSVPYRDPLSVVLEDPKVPERKRYCADCGDPVGAATKAPGELGGWCPHCGAPYSFTPKLWPGDLVGGQYLVAGCIAHGGLGWVYLARTRTSRTAGSC